NDVSAKILAIMPATQSAMPMNVGVRGSGVTTSSIPDAPITSGKLIADIDSCISFPDLIRRAPELLKLKNRLSVEEAKDVETAFKARLLVLDPPSEAGSAPEVPAENSSTASGALPSNHHS